jgi:hypothetical protein
MSKQSTTDSYCLCCACGVWLRTAADFTMSMRRDGRGLVKSMEVENGFYEAYPGQDLGNAPHASHVIHEKKHMEALYFMEDAKFRNKGACDEIKGLQLHKKKYTLKANVHDLFEVKEIYDRITVDALPFEPDAVINVCQRCNLNATNLKEFADMLFRAKRSLFTEDDLQPQVIQIGADIKIIPYLVLMLHHCWDEHWDSTKRPMHLIMCWLALSVCVCLRDLVFDERRHMESQHTKVANVEYYMGIFLYYMLRLHVKEVNVTVHDFLLLYFYELAVCPKNRARETILNLVMPTNYEALANGDQTIFYNTVVARLVRFFDEWILGYIHPVLAGDQSKSAEAWDFFPHKADVRFIRDQCMPVVGRDVVAFIDALGINFMLNRFGSVLSCSSQQYRDMVNKTVFDFFLDRELALIKKNARVSSKVAYDIWLGTRRLGEPAQHQHYAAGTIVKKQDFVGALKGA